MFFSGKQLRRPQAFIFATSFIKITKCLSSFLCSFIFAFVICICLQIVVHTSHANDTTRPNNSSGPHGACTGCHGILQEANSLQNTCAHLKHIRELCVHSFRREVMHLSGMKSSVCGRPWESGATERAGKWWKMKCSSHSWKHTNAIYQLACLALRPCNFLFSPPMSRRLWVWERRVVAMCSLSCCVLMSKDVQTKA